MDSAGTAVRPLISVADDRVTASIGRSARLELVFERRRGRTALTHAYAEPPFRVGCTFAEADGLHMILATVAPGVFGGDCLHQTIQVGAGARVRLTSQSAVQIHPSPGGVPAKLHSAFTVENDGELRCFWDPLIPFAAARLEQKTAIRLGKQAHLFWSDATMAGRVGRGERWAFTNLSHELAVWRGDALEYVERYQIAPETDHPERIWMAGDDNYFGTTLASGQPIAAAFAADLHEALGGIERVRAAADRLAGDVLLVRLLGSAGAKFHEARILAADTIGRPFGA